MPATPVPELKIETIIIPEEILVRCSGRITFSSAHMLEITICRLIPQAKHVLLDLTDVNYMDGSGLDALVEVCLSAKTQRCQMRLINFNQRLAGLFRSTMLASIFKGLEFPE